MSISDLSFIFIFLPVLFFVYLFKTKMQKYFLLVFSLFFYACGSPRYFILFLMAVSVNIVIGYLITLIKHKGYRGGIALGIGCIINVGLLFYYKYYDFAITNINHIFNTSITTKNLLLPLGISFFVFKSISYLADIYCGKIEVKKNPVYAALYLSFFSQIASGPICRYNDFYEDFEKEKNISEKIDDFSEGIYKFAIGFIKKILIANVLSHITNEVFALDVSEATAAILWLGSLCFSLQLYYDFSGYSDMAIGIGRVFGISCKENFNYPYMTKSVSEFWRRWHISLGSWFRDYIYIPLGGSRVNSRIRLFFNLFVVWFLTGIWHGANWNYIIWGLIFFLLIAFEKNFNIPSNFNNKIVRNIYRIFTLLIINFQWILFNSNSIGNAVRYIGRMFSGKGDIIYNQRAAILLSEYGFFILIALVFCVPVLPWINEWKEKNKVCKICINIAISIVVIMGFVWALTFIIAGQNNPFMYANF